LTNIGPTPYARAANRPRSDLTNRLSSNSTGNRPESIAPAPRLQPAGSVPVPPPGPDPFAGRLRPAPPPMPARSKRSLTALVISGLAAIFLLGAGSYFWFKQKNDVDVVAKVNNPVSIEGTKSNIDQKPTTPPPETTGEQVSGETEESNTDDEEQQKKSELIQSMLKKGTNLEEKLKNFVSTSNDIIKNINNQQKPPTFNLTDSDIVALIRTGKSYESLEAELTAKSTSFFQQAEEQNSENALSKRLEEWAGGFDEWRKQYKTWESEADKLKECANKEDSANIDRIRDQIKSVLEREKFFAADPKEFPSARKYREWIESTRSAQVKKDIEDKRQQALKTLYDARKRQILQIQFSFDEAQKSSPLKISMNCPLHFIDANIVTNVTFDGKLPPSVLPTENQPLSVTNGVELIWVKKLFELRFIPNESSFFGFENIKKLERMHQELSDIQREIRNYLNSTVTISSVTRSNAKMVDPKMARKDAFKSFLTTLSQAEPLAGTNEESKKTQREQKIAAKTLLASFRQMTAHLEKTIDPTSLDQYYLEYTKQYQDIFDPAIDDLQNPTLINALEGNASSQDINRPLSETEIVAQMRAELTAKLKKCSAHLGELRGLYQEMKDVKVVVINGIDELRFGRSNATDIGSNEPEVIDTFLMFFIPEMTLAKRGNP